MVFPGETETNKFLAAGPIPADKSLLRIMWFIQTNPKRDVEVAGQKSVDEFNYCVAYTWFEQTQTAWTLIYPKNQGGEISQTMAVYHTFVNGSTNAPYVDFVIPDGTFVGGGEATKLKYIIGVKGREYQTGASQVAMNYTSDPDNYIELNVNNSLYQMPDFDMPVV